MRNKIENNTLALKTCCFYTDKIASTLLKHLFLHLTNALFIAYCPPNFLPINKNIFY